MSIIQHSETNKIKRTFKKISFIIKHLAFRVHSSMLSIKIQTFGWSFAKEKKIPREGEFLTSIPIFNGWKAKRIPEILSYFMFFDKITIFF